MGAHGDDGAPPTTVSTHAATAVPPPELGSAHVKNLLGAAALDFVLVIVFCLIGRRSHDEAASMSGVVRTAWPFVGGMALGWAVASRGKGGLTPEAVWPFGVIVWAGTLVGGMILRAVDDQGVAVSFVIVAGSVLAVLLLGWRLIFHAIRRR